MDADELHQLRADHPAWLAWRQENAGGVTWWATRRRMLTHAETRHGLRHQLAALTCDALQAELEKQARLENDCAQTNKPASAASIA